MAETDSFLWTVHLHSPVFRGLTVLAQQVHIGKVINDLSPKINRHKLTKGCL